MTASLIEKLERLTDVFSRRPAITTPWTAVTKEEVLTIVRKHVAEQQAAATLTLTRPRYRAEQSKVSSEAVERVAKAIRTRAHFTALQADTKFGSEALAKVAIDALQAAPVAEQPPFAIPTEQMFQGARGFIKGLDLNYRTWSAMGKHLDAGGYDSLPLIHQKAKDDPHGHITKWDVADCIWQLMARYHPVPSPSSDPDRHSYDGMSAVADLVAAKPGTFTTGDLKAESGWIEWSGGESPVPPDTLVEYEMRDGEIDIAVASVLKWRMLGWYGDILRYRVSTMAEAAYAKVQDALWFCAAGQDDDAGSKARDAIAVLPALKPQSTVANNLPTGRERP